MEDTLTSGATEEDADPGVRMVLVVAYHPRPELLGRVLRIPSGGLRFGRDHGESRLELSRDRRMSRSHAEILQIRGQYVLHDLKSRNGTWLNGRRVAHGTLNDGDIVRMGSIALFLRPEPAVHDAPEGLLGAGPAFATLCERIAAFGPNPSVVLLEGEPGVGKGVVARALHEASGRKGAFVTFDCGSVSPGVMHSELFGHRAGAFSGATGSRSGLVEAARGGTLFLDEVGDASPELQRSLLRLLEEGEYRPVGADRPRSADVRVVAATNRDLDARVQTEQFRFDLLTRLRRLGIRVPTLRERLEDVPLLATRFAIAKAGKPVVLHRQLAFSLLEHSWPGNVRELDAVMERAVVLSRGESTLRYAPSLIDATPKPPPSPRTTPSRAPEGRPTPERLEQVLRGQGGNVTHAARVFGVARHTMYRWIREADLDLEDFR